MGKEVDRTMPVEALGQWPLAGNLCDRDEAVLPRHPANGALHASVGRLQHDDALGVTECGGNGSWMRWQMSQSGQARGIVAAQPQMLHMVEAGGGRGDDFLGRWRKKSRRKW